MKAYSIFDDLDEVSIKRIESCGIELVLNPTGTPRPDPVRMKSILEQYDCVIIGTSQKISEEMFINISSPRIIATASVGLDHIHVPEEKRDLVTIINTPKANAQSVAEYTVGCALACCKRLFEGERLYSVGKNNKSLYKRPEDLSGKIMGVIGAGNISAKIMEYAGMLGLRVICWTPHPEKHAELEEMGIRFCDLRVLCETADVISVNLPNNEGTKGLISEELISCMKDTAIFISVSRQPTVDIQALIEKAKRELGFYVCLDIDVDSRIVSMLSGEPNILITPHIAGGTVETRRKMFCELAESVCCLCETHK